jgi:hypothetical protein
VGQFAQKTHQVRGVGTGLAQTGDKTHQAIQLIYQAFLRRKQINLHRKLINPTAHFTNLFYLRFIHRRKLRFSAIRSIIGVPTDSPRKHHRKFGCDWSVSTSPAVNRSTEMPENKIEPGGP